MKRVMLMLILAAAVRAQLYGPLDSDINDEVKDVGASGTQR